MGQGVESLGGVTAFAGGGVFNSEFSEGEISGIFIRRQPDLIEGGKRFERSVFINSAMIANIGNFSWSSEKWENGAWRRLSGDLDFGIDEVAVDKKSANWYLRQSAACGYYSISCGYYRFLIVYTSDYTYFKVKSSGADGIKNFEGGTYNPLNLEMEFDSGATVKNLDVIGYIDGFEAGNISGEDIINPLINTGHEGGLNVKVETIDGVAVERFSYQLFNGNLRVEFPSGQLKDKEAYLVKVFNNIEPGVYSSFIIDNIGEVFTEIRSGADSWIIFFVMGLLLVLGGSGLYLVPQYIRYKNELRVQEERVRIMKEKDPTAYVEEKKITFLGSLFAGIKGAKKKIEIAKQKREGTYVEKKEDLPFSERPILEADLVNERAKPQKFSDVLRENLQMRETAKKNNISVDKLEELKREQKEIEKAEVDSLAFLRDDDDIVVKQADVDPAREAQKIDANTRVVDGVVFSNFENAGNNFENAGNNDNEIIEGGVTDKETVDNNGDHNEG
jgi:hypothetical protein